MNNNEIIYQYEGKLSEISINTENSVILLKLYVDKSLVVEGEKNNNGSLQYYICCRCCTSLENGSYTKPGIVQVKKEDDQFYLELKLDKKEFLHLLSNSKKIKASFISISNSNNNESTEYKICKLSAIF